MLMTKKSLIIIIIITAVAVGLIWSLAGKPGEEPGERGFFARLFPSREEQPIAPRPWATTTPEMSEQELISQRKRVQLLQLVPNAVAGAAFTEGKVRYIEKSTGHVYEVGPNGEEKTRISNTTIPRIFETFWSFDAGSAVLRIFDQTGSQVKNFSASFTGSTTQGIFLHPDISSIAVSPAEDKIFYLFPSGSQTIGILANFQNKNQKQIINTPFGDFLASWPEKNTLGLLSKPSGLVDGFLYKFNLKTRSLEKVLGEKKGLFAKWSADAEKIIYSEAVKNGLSLNLWDIAQSQAAPFYFQTLAEKCAFANSSENIIYCAVPESLSRAILPDDWYQGIVSFSDKIWQTDVKTGQTSILTDSQENIDAINLFLDPEDNYLFFTNKKDGTLWRLKLYE